jgi:hypothetical protein
MGELITTTPRTSTTPQPQLELSKLGDLITRVFEALNIVGVDILPSTIPSPSLLDIKKREAITIKFDSVPDDLRITLRRVAEHLLIHGKSDSVMMTKDATLGEASTILSAIDLGHALGLFTWQFEINARHMLAVNPNLQNALANYLWKDN